MPIQPDHLNRGTAMHTTRKLTGLIGALLLAVGALLLPHNPVISTTLAAPPGGGLGHWMGEFERGTDLEHYANWVLDEVGVPASSRGERYPDCGGCWKMEALSMVWLLLTAAEADQANRMISQSGPLTAGEVAGIVTLPSPVGMTADTTLNDTGWFAQDGQQGQYVPSHVERIGVPVDEWDASRTPPSMRGVRLAVIDTGVDARHPDLNVVGGHAGCALDERGPEGWGVDPHGHGTFVSSMAAARHDDNFITAPAQNAAIVDVPVFGASGSASAAQVACGVNQALELGADVMNASLGGPHIATRCGGPSVYTNAWCKAGARSIVVVAAGNNGDNAIAKGPANVTSVVTVGAIIDFDGRAGGDGRGAGGCAMFHRDDHLALFSNWGTVVDVVAPGACLTGLIPGERWTLGHGTSYASPIVAGVILNFLVRYDGCEGDRAVRAVLAYAARDEFADMQYTGWPGDDAPPMIRYVVPERERSTAPDSDPCRIPRETS